MPDYFGLKLCNNDVTSMEEVVRILQNSLNLCEADSFQRMMAVHKNNGFIVEMGTREEVERLSKRLFDEISKQSSALEFEVVGPFDETERSVWKNQLGYARVFPRYVGIIFWVVVTLITWVLIQKLVV